MNILLLFTFHLISGPVHCSDVIGYPGGHLLIDYKRQNYNTSTVYFCKLKPQAECEYLITVQGRGSAHKDRFSLYDSGEFITVIFRNLSVQDAGMYQGGVRSVWSHDINLKVNSDPCCSRTQSVTGYLGQTVTISCSYPVEFETNIRSVYKLDGRSEHEVIRTSGTQQHQEGRFSISNDRRNKVFSVNISDVREDDAGLYSCAVGNEATEVTYQSLFTAIQLQVTDVTRDPTKIPDGIPHTPEPGSSLIIIIIIIVVCVCVIVLLMGGSVLIYKLRSNRTQDSASIHQQTETNNMTADYENDPPQIQNTIMHPVYQSLNPNTNQSDSVYQSLNPNTNQSDSVYQSLDPYTNQSDSVYQSLDPYTNQSDSVYQSLDPNTIQSYSVYQSLDSNTNQSDSVYQSLDFNTNQSDSVYQSLDFNTNQSDSVYQTLTSNTNHVQSARV
ncbi:uncharacterized protein LOC128602487 isoform X2 [Ictalurus furcatus]|uniref:uncharacterized protein LOC128602487 isoform X2 n=1 Tax=Ictalurus furcatus TaxID=66913 RepID=UPI0023509F2E|nr:uncharacterized protein LOC128602487 isoform X2 [Ictalurus furcatus]